MEVELDRKEPPWRRIAPLVVEDVALKDIDGADRTFQFRTTSKRADLRPSLLEHGQMKPIALISGDNGWRIVDGFTRFDTIEELEWRCIKAMLYPGMSDHEAMALSYASNATRESLSFADKANAMQKAVNEGFSHEEVGKLFSVDQRTIDRYLEIPEVLREHVDCKLVTMAHARALKPLVELGDHQRLDQVLDWVRDAKVSVPQVKQRLKAEGISDRRGGACRYGVVKNGMVRSYAFRVDENTPPEELRKLAKFLNSASESVTRWLDDSTDE